MRLAAATSATPPSKAYRVRQAVPMTVTSRPPSGFSTSPRPSQKRQTLFRHVDIDLAAYPMLAWRWYIELPIRSPLDERTREGTRRGCSFGS